MNNKLLYTLSMRLLAMVAFTFTSCSLFDLDEIDGHKYVDLGLSVKWATCNVGADSPDDYGDYFAWGETQPQTTYNWSTYKWCKGSISTLTKYCDYGLHGTVDNKTQLDLSDDAARANWGGSWRMPTDDEWNELLLKCTWTWTTYYDYSDDGEKGYKVTSNINGNSIFLPVAGYRFDSSLHGAGSGYYWLRSLGWCNPLGAMFMCFNWGTNSLMETYRCSGLSVRPVCP